MWGRGFGGGRNANSSEQPEWMTLSTDLFIVITLQVFRVLDDPPNSTWESGGIVISGLQLSNSHQKQHLAEGWDWNEEPTAEGVDKWVF